jgi:hypothetical protein
MQKMLCGMLLCIVILTGCQGAKKKTATQAAPAHNVPSAAYPGPKTENLANAEPTSQPYPGPAEKSADESTVSDNISSAAYPGPGTSGNQSNVNVYAPADGDEKLIRGAAFVEIKDSRMLQLETAPVQVKLHLKGTLPNACYALRVNPAKPDEQKRIQVEVYSVTKPGQVCAEALKDFDVLIPLGSFPTGHYSVYINGELLGEFDA